MVVRNACAVILPLVVACVSAPTTPERRLAAPDVALALGRLLAPLASPEVAADVVRSSAWPGAQIREEAGVVQVDFGRSAQLHCGFAGRFTLTRHDEQVWRVQIDELSDGRLRYWGTAEVRPDGRGLLLRLDLLVLEGSRGAELIVSGRIRRVEGRWRLEAEGVGDTGMSRISIRAARRLAARPRWSHPRIGDGATDSPYL